MFIICVKYLSFSIDYSSLDHLQRHSHAIRCNSSIRLQNTNDRSSFAHHRPNPKPILIIAKQGSFFCSFDFSQHSQKNAYLSPILVIPLKYRFIPFAWNFNLNEFYFT